MLAVLMSAKPALVTDLTAQPELWAEVKRVADIHRFSGLLAYAVGPVLPPAERQWRDSVLMAHHRRHASQLAALRRLTDAFTEAGIPCLSLKGPALAERFYPKPYLRTSGDIDLLIPYAKTGAASRLMKRLGFRLEELYPWRFQQKIAPHLTFFPTNQSPMVEVHYFLTGGPTPIRSEEFLERSAGAVLSPADEAFYCCLHAANHAFHRLRWVYDTLLIARTLTPDQRNEVRKLGIRYRVTGQLVAASLAAEEFFGEKLNLDLTGFTSHLRAVDMRRMVQRVEGRPVRFSESAGYYTDLCRMGSIQQAARLLGYAVETVVKKRLFYSIPQADILSATLPA